MKLAAEVLLGRTFIFYYLWYGNPEHNGKWEHWDHEVLPHWTEQENRRHANIGQRHNPPEKLHSPYYPLRGAYSSTDETLLLEHFHEIRGLNPESPPVVVLSWWGQASREGTSDTQGVQTDHRVRRALVAAEKANVSIAWHLEPYPGRSATSVAEDVRYLEKTYGCLGEVAGGACPGSTAIFRPGPRREAVYFVYDSYHIAANDWASVLQQGAHAPKSTTVAAAGVVGVPRADARVHVPGPHAEHGREATEPPTGVLDHARPVPRRGPVDEVRRREVGVEALEAAAREVLAVVRL